MASKGTYNKKTGKRTVNTSVKRAAQRVKDAKAAGFTTTSKYKSSPSQGDIRAAARDLQGGTAPITPESMAKVNAVELPQKNVPVDLSGSTNQINAMLAGANGGTYSPESGFVNPTPTDTTGEQGFTDLFKSYMGTQEQLNADRPSQESFQREMNKELRRKENLVNSLQNQLTTITTDRDAAQLGLEGQGRGISETIIGGQQARIGREAAIQALPIQAQLATAQGDLDSARTYLGQLYQAKSADAQAEYQYKSNLATSIYGFLNTQQQRRVDAATKANDRAFGVAQSNIAYQRQLGLQALEYGQTGLISGISAIDPNSPTFEADMAAFSSQLKDPMKALQMEGQRAQNAANWALANERMIGGERFMTPDGGEISVPTFEEWAEENGGRTWQVGGTEQQMNDLRSRYDDEVSVMEQAAKVSALSPLAREVVNNPQAYYGFTATERGEIFTELASVGLDTKGIISGQKKTLPATQVDNLSQARNVKQDVEKLYQMLQDLPGNGPIGGRLQALDPYNDKVVAINAQITRIVPGLARGIFNEVGVLTDQDVDRYRNTIANPNMTDSQIEQLHNDTVFKIDQSIGSTIDTFNMAGYNVDNFIDQPGQTNQPADDGLTDDEAYELYLLEVNKNN